MGLRDDPVPHAVVEPAGDDGGQQHGGVLGCEALQPQFRQARQAARLPRFADAEHDRHRLGEQPASHEAEDLLRRAVEPLKIVHETQHGLLLGVRRQERQRGEAHQEAVGRSAGCEAERDIERVALRLRERVRAIEQRPAELLQTRERQLALRLDAGDVDDPERSRLARGVPHQRRLAHARLAADDQHAAPPLTRARNEPVERFALAGPAPQGRRRHSALKL